MASYDPDADDDYEDIKAGRIAPEAFLPPQVPSTPSIQSFQTPGAAATDTVPQAAPPPTPAPTATPLASMAPAFSAQSAQSAPADAVRTPQTSPSSTTDAAPAPQIQQPSTVPAPTDEGSGDSAPAASAPPVASNAQLIRNYFQDQANQLKYHASQGGQTEVLPTGATVIKQDADGNPLYHPAVVQPFVRGDDGNGYQVSRDEYGNQHYFDLSQGQEGQDYHVDEQTGDKYVTTSGADGSSKREVIGNDPLVAQISGLKSDLQKHATTSQAADIDIARATDGTQGGGPLAAASLGDLRDRASSLQKDLKPLQQQLKDLSSYTDDSNSTPQDLSAKQQLQQQVQFKQNILDTVQGEVDARDSTIADARQRRDGIAQQRLDGQTNLAVLQRVRQMGGVSAVQGDLSTLAQGGALPADRAALLANVGLANEEPNTDGTPGTMLRVTPTGASMLPPDVQQSIAQDPSKFMVTGNDAPVQPHVARAAQNLVKLAGAGKQFGASIAGGDDANSSTTVPSTGAPGASTSLPAQPGSTTAASTGGTSPDGTLPAQGQVQRVTPAGGPTTTTGQPIPPPAANHRRRTPSARMENSPSTRRIPRWAWPRRSRMACSIPPARRSLSVLLAGRMPSARSLRRSPAARRS